MSSTISFSGTDLPNYITDRVHANERKYAGTHQVYIFTLCIICAFRGPLVFPCLQQRQSAIFTTRLDDNYDAYEKDIAMVSFFFKKNTVFEFKR